MGSVRIILPNENYAGFTLAYWLKDYWQHFIPLYAKGAVSSPDTNQTGVVTHAAGKYAEAFDVPKSLVYVQKGAPEKYSTSIYRGFFVPLVKFFAADFLGDGNDFIQLSNVARSLALNSNVKIQFQYGKASDGKIEPGQKSPITLGNLTAAMPYYCESYEISLPLSAVGTAYAAGSPSGISKAASAAFCVMFEFLEQGTYVVDVKASYVFN